MSVLKKSSLPLVAGPYDLQVGYQRMSFDVFVGEEGG